MALADYDDSHHTSSFAPQSHFLARPRRQIGIKHSLFHTPSQERAAARLQARCLFAHVINTTFKHYNNRVLISKSIITTQLTVSSPTQMYTSSVSHQPSSPRLLFRDLINVLISYGQGSSTSKHRSLTKQHLLASLPTSAAPLSQQQAPRHFLTINHLVQHSIHKYLTIPPWFLQRSTPHRSFIISCISS